MRVRGMEDVIASGPGYERRKSRESTLGRPASALCIWGQGAALEILEGNGKMGANPGPCGGKLPD